ncbi:MAG: transglutaminase domain-containing protein [Alphaproteobacteria bacterium]|nr:transglutaminase domain-containing protein [Alphaproteobacteria bacterium]
MSEIKELFQATGYNGVNEKEADAIIYKWVMENHPSINQTLKDYSKTPDSNNSDDSDDTIVQSLKDTFKKNIETDSSSSDQENLQAPLPNLKTLHQPIQDFVNSINNNPELSSLDIIARIHTFVINKMSYSYEEAKNETSMSSNYNKVLQNYTSGDCDNHATFAIALLRYTDFKPENIAFLAEAADYGRIKGGHAVCIVNVDDQFYILDMNMENEALLENMTYVGYAAKEDHNGKTVPQIASIEPMILYPIQKGEEALYYYDTFIKYLSKTFSEIEEEVNNTDTPENTHDATAPPIENSLPSPMP